MSGPVLAYSETACGENENQQHLAMRATSFVQPETVPDKTRDVDQRKSGNTVTRWSFWYDV